MTQRYTNIRNSSGLGFSDGISPSKDGEFVYYDDYAAALAREAGLRGAYAELVNAARRASHATTNDGINGPFYTDEAIALQRALAALDVKP